MTQSHARMRALIDQLQTAPGLLEHLPAQEREVISAALGGQDVYAIAQQHRMSEGAVWTVLTNAARLAGGTSIADPVQTGGLGSDPGAGEGD